MDNFMSNLNAGKYKKDIESSIGNDFLPIDKAISEVLASYERVLDSTIVKQGIEVSEGYSLVKKRK